MPIIAVMKLLFSAVFIFLALNVFAAPLQSGYALAPRTTASAAEKDQAYINARLRVIEASRKYEGVPYRYGGMTASGLDCSGFIGLSFRDALGIALPRSASGLYSWVENITLDKAQPGDFLFFKTDRSGNITHVALYLGDKRFIHAASAGSRTGVIYSNLNETYWANTYAGAGRAFPEVTSGFNLGNNSAIVNSGGSSSGANNPGVNNPGGQGSDRQGTAGQSSSGQSNRPPASKEPAGESQLLVGVAFAPIWNGFIKGGDLVRGFTSQICLGADTYSLGTRMVFGLELRPEYDGGLGVFRLPITFSWGTSEKIRIFFGPVFSFGDASLSIDDEERNYSGGTSWLGTVGLTAAPFVLKTGRGEFSPYLELAWQSYFSDNSNFDLAADFSAGFRFSTGVRWLINIL